MCSPRPYAATNDELPFAAPCGRAELLLVGRDAFGQPARHALLRQLQRHDVRQLVPQRRRPVEVAGRARFRRVERHHAAEAGAERADHAGQPDGAHREVVVLREHLDENRPLRRELILLRERGERLLRERRDVFAHHRRFARMALEDDVAFGRHVELLERVQHLQQVERRLVELVDRKRFLEHLTRFGFVAGAQQLHAERRKRSDVVRIDLERLAAQRHRFFEAVIRRRELGRDAIRAAEPRVDLERGRRLPV